MSARVGKVFESHWFSVQGGHNSGRPGKVRELHEKLNFVRDF